MPSRNRLKGIIHGVSGKINSRNNDISGFWGVGYIYNSAFYSDATSCSFDLIQQVSSPHFEFSDKWTEIYRKFIFDQLAKNNLPETSVVSVKVDFEFNISSKPELERLLHIYGQAYCCTISLVSDTGKEYTAMHYSKCRRNPPMPPVIGEEIRLREYEKL